MARCGDGLAAGADLVEAARTAVADARAHLEGATPDLVAVFVAGGTVDEIDAALLAAHEASGARTTVGCSAAGVIGAGLAIADGPAVSAWAAVLPGARARSFQLEVIRTKDAWAVVGMPVPREHDVVGLLLADPWSFPVEGFVGAAHRSTESLPLVGGMAHGPGGAATTRLMVDGVIHDRGAVGAVLSGVRAATLVNPGHRPFGAPMTVTGSIGSMVVELAGRPAAERLAAAVAALSPADRDLADRGVMLGVAIDEYVDDHGADAIVVRTIVDVDHDRGSLELPDPVRVGTTVRFCLVDPDAASAHLLDGLLGMRGPSTDDQADGALVMACIDRYVDTPELLNADIRALGDVLGATGVAGMLAGGEIGPAAGGNHVHGLTSTVLALTATDVVHLPGDAAPSEASSGGRA